MVIEKRSGPRSLSRRFCLLLLLVTGLLVFPSQRVESFATVPAGFTDTLVTGGLSNATAMDVAPDGRLFVCEQGGALRVIKNGALLVPPFVTVTTVADGERGLLGVTFDPNFSLNQFVYVYYTAQTPALHNRVSRFKAAGDTAVPNSETVIIELDNLNPPASNHNGGAIHFGPDGRLYIAVGDNANSANAQSLMTLHGKVLRLFTGGGIPSDNPFYTQASGNRRAIWVLGLRNPFTFGFQPGTTRVFINDVGQSSWEEVNDLISGANYGWPTCEGNCNPPNASFRDPIYTYLSDPPVCAITGGAFYNPQTSQFPANYLGRYFFADFCGGWIKTLDPANGNAVADFATGISFPVDLKASAEGTLYYLARGASSLNRINFPAGQGCVYTISPGLRNFSAKETASTISVTAGAGCLWSVSNSLPWVTIDGGMSGNGNGTVNFTVGLNGGVRRTGTFTVAGRLFTVRQGANFLDVAQDHIFYEFIGKLSAAAITLGCDPNGPLFCPTAPVSREQMGAFIIRAVGDFNPPLPPSQRFTDVPPSNIFYSFIDEMATRGVTLGCDPQGTQYCPTSNVTRDQMAAFMIRALDDFNPPTPAMQRYVDVPPQNLFYAFIEQMALRGITLGCDVNGPLYCPTANVSRAQMAAFLGRAFAL